MSSGPDPREQRPTRRDPWPRVDPAPAHPGRVTSSRPRPSLALNLAYNLPLPYRPLACIMIDVSTMSSPILPVEVWLQVSRQLTYEGCKVAERLNRSFRELVAEPDLAAVRFVETEPNPIRRQALFKHEGLFPKRRVEGRFEPVAHLPDTAVLTNPLFRCVDWTPASTIDSLLVRWNIHGDWLERPIAIRTIDACEEAATSPAVKLLAVSIARVLE